MKIFTTRYKRFTRVAFMASIACIACISVAFVVAAKTSAVADIPIAGLGDLSNQVGQPVALTPVDDRALQRFAASGIELGAPSLLSTRHGRSYYRLANATGRPCFAVGPALPVSYRLGQIQCAADFPSAERPVLDFTVLQEATNDPASARVVQSEGVAADGVADVAFLTDRGKLVSVVPVVANVYSVTSPPDAHVTTLVGRDANGAVVWSGSLALPTSSLMP
jgi:hypothetical protein